MRPPIYLLFLLVLFGQSSFAGINAKSYVIADANSGAILEARNPYKKLQPASTTKIVTAMVVLDRLSPSKWVKISKRASQQVRVKAYLKAGHKYRVRDLLKALLIKSANDAAVALAEAVAGSEKKFALLMTKKARSCGAYNTRFKSASGLTKKGQYTTAHDLYLLMQCARDKKYDRIKKYARIKHTVIRSNKGQKHTLKNHNRLFTQSPYYSIGKTGFTRAAKYCYVSYLEKDNVSTVISMLGSQQLWPNAKKLAKRSMKLAKYKSNKCTKKIQAQLKKKGLYKAKIDGIYGKQTRLSVKKFQLQNKLPAHGYIDSKTLYKLSGKTQCS